MKKKIECECSCTECDCSCHKEKDGFLGRVQLSFYQFPDKTHEVNVTFTRFDDLPNPKEDKRGFTVMGLLAAQVQDYAKKQLKAVDMMLVGKEEMKIIMDEHDRIKADVDKYQQPLPFPEDKDNG
jgi:hypothetical protein